MPRCSSCSGRSSWILAPSWSSTTAASCAARRSGTCVWWRATRSSWCTSWEAGEGMTTAVELMQDAPLTIGGRTFQSRLMVGTGKYRDNETMVRAMETSGAEIVTVAVRRVNLDRTKEEGILYHLEPKKYFLLANTAGCFTAEDAVRYARLAREAGFNEFVKLEVIGDQETLLPDVQGLLEAARTLVREGVKLLAYTHEDLLIELRLGGAGGAAVLARRGDAGLRKRRPRAAPRSSCSGRCVAAPRSRRRAIATSRASPSGIVAWRTSSPRGCCAGGPSSTSAFPSPPPIPASTISCASAPISCAPSIASPPTPRCPRA